jgi:hypothetical protein
MQILTIKGYLTDTVNSTEHSQAADFKSALDAIAAEKDGKITRFEVAEGEATVGATPDGALKHIMEQLKGLDGVQVEQLSQIQDQFNKNKRAQESINQRRETRKKTKQQKEAK